MVDRDPPTLASSAAPSRDADPTPGTADGGAAAGGPSKPVGSFDPIEALAEWGPAAPEREPVSTDRAYEMCHALARRRYENFSVLTGLVPEKLRDDFAAVYAFCRWADDLADETHRLSASDNGAAVRTPELDRARALELLAWWRTGLERCFAGEAAHPVYVALAETVRRHDLRPEPFRRLLDAFEQDQRVSVYASWDDVIGYCRGSADPVGHLVLTLAGHRPPDEDPANAEMYRLSDLVCSALQLTNFWQDVRTDLLDRGRIYMPTDETGFDLDTLRAMAARGDDHETRVRYIKTLRPLVERTMGMFDEARALPKIVDPAVGPVVWLFAAGGRRVLNKVLAGGCTTLWNRPRLRGYEKAALVGLGYARRWVDGRRGPRGRG